MQQELFNGWVYIFLKGGNESLLNDIKDALEQPRKVLSLGRSEDVVFIRRVEFVEGKKKTAKEVAIRYPTYVATSIEMLRRKEYPTYAIPIKVIFKNEETPVKHKAEINTNTFRMLNSNPLSTLVLGRF
ncbi:type I-E CRISPR-associated protein Cas5/CasD [Thermococcus sp. JCM 11816]|uniref:type I-E CRISPR-associated protein Cas5/CasD n=1 Tax=Thermococcus sp. (strain JCM 11816 / KS-1) TaxID=1295125 RepID=UPI0006CFCDA7